MKRFKFISMFLVTLLLTCNACNDFDSSNKHTVVWLNYDNSLLYKDDNVKSGETPVYRGETPSRGEDYLFDGWTPEITPTYYDTTYTAKYISNRYTVKWVNQDNSLLKTEVYRYGQIPSYGKTPTSSDLPPVGCTYVFDGWQPAIKPVTEDITYKATYVKTDIKYTITLEPEGGILTNNIFHCYYGSSYNLPSPVRNGYTFKGWYDYGDDLLSHTKISSSGYYYYKTDKTFYAEYTPIKYNISYVLDGGVNNKSNPISYYSGEIINLLDPTKEGYIFTGWYDGNNNRITTIEESSYGDLTLYARWTPAQYNLSVFSEDNSKGTVAIISGSGYADETIIVEATPQNDCIFKGWYHNSTQVSTDTTYSFVMPLGDYSLSARFYTQADQAEEDKLISLGVLPNYDSETKRMTYGLYPQSVIKDAELISVLNTIETPSGNGWYLYNDSYYAKVKPLKSGKFLDGSTFDTSNYYWFKCEPIKWRVCKSSKNNSTGKTSYFLLSDVTLDAKQYCSGAYTRTIDGKTIYRNNYEYSDIRLWLNNDFYNTAFFLNNDYIKETMLDNNKMIVTYVNQNVASLLQEVQCNYTNDKVFLMSSYEYYTSDYGFTNIVGATNRRICRASDYSVINGTYFSSDEAYSDCVWYMTRSHYVRQGQVDKSLIDIIRADGSISGGAPYDTYGIRPSVTIELNVL